MDIRGLTLKEHPHVYPVREDSLLLATSATVAPGERVVEIGCGLGLAALAAAREGARVLATDMNPNALSVVMEEANLNSIKVDCLRTDLFRGLRRFDVVLFNPPYLPTRPEDRDIDPWNNLALDGGKDGWAVLRPFLSALPEHLSPGGRAYVVLASVSGSLLDPFRELAGLPDVFLGSIAGERELQEETLWVVEITTKITA